MEISKEDKLEHALEDAPLAVDAGAVEADMLNTKLLGVFVEILKNRKGSREWGQRSVDKVE